MSNPNILQPSSMPEHVATVFEIGLETGLRQDRLLALKAANHFDLENKPTADLGLQVVTAFMKQRGIEFDKRGGRLETFRWHRNLEMPEDAGMIGQIAQAIGSTIGMETHIHELVDAPSRMVAVTKPGSGKDMYLASSNETDSMEIYSAKPYLVFQRCLRSATFSNFHRAMRGLEDEPEPNHPIIMPA